MATKSVAVDGEVQATPGTAMYSPADSGAWSAGAVQHTTYAALTVGGVAVVHEASCEFTFSGADSKSNGAPVTGSETVTLTASPTSLMRGKDAVLRDGDEAEGSYGNKLRAVTSRHLKSA